MTTIRLTTLVPSQIHGRRNQLAHMVGLKSDGTVVAVEDNDYRQCDVGGWTNIIQVAADGDTVGLRSDGTIVAVGCHYNTGQCYVGWMLIS